MPLLPAGGTSRVGGILPLALVELPGKQTCDRLIDHINPGRKGFLGGFIQSRRSHRDSIEYYLSYSSTFLDVEETAMRGTANDTHDAIVEACAGALGGCVATIATYPLMAVCD